MAQNAKDDVDADVPEITAREPGWADLRDPVMLLALGLGSGLLFRRGAGTAGTVLGVAIYLLVEPASDQFYAAVVGVLLLVGIPICGSATRRLGHNDHPAIVLDEIASFLVVMVGLPATPGWVLAGFAMFRLYDIHKPWPICALDKKLPGGLGVMADDLAAALLACATLHAARIAMTSLGW